MAELKRTKTPEQALNALMYLCSKAEKSTGDAYRLLYKWGVDKAEHDKIVAKLIEGKFIDNRRYAEAFARDKMNFSRWGIYKIRTALKSKQIGDDIIEEVLSAADVPAMEEKLERRLTAKMRAVKYKNKYDLRGKLLRYGTGLGFGYESVSGIVDELVKNIKEDEDDF